MGFGINKHSDTNTRIFLDRNDIFSLIDENVCQYNEQHNYFKLFSFYGMGGIGKTQLVKKIKNFYQGSKCDIYFFPLEILNNETIPAILLCIRKKFDHTPHFDYALFRYWDFISCDRVSRESLYSFYQKAFVRTGKIMDSLGIKVMSTEHIISKLITLYEQNSITDLEKETVLNLLQDKIENLYIYLAETLAKDIEKELDGRKYMFLFDAYDLGRSNYKFDWLKYLVNSFDNGMFFVTSRECLNWFDDTLVKQNVVEQCSLESIPPKEVQNYLLEKNYTQEQIDFIIEKTECIPLYLDLAMQMNKKKFSSEYIRIGFNNKEDLVKNFLSHLNEDEQVIIDYLSVVRIFNLTIYEYAVKFNKFSALKYSFSNFEKSTIVRYIENYDGLYKIHAVLAKNIAYLVDEQTRAMIINDYLITLHTRILPDLNILDDTKYTLIINIYQLFEDEQIAISERQSEELIDLFFYIIDCGYGNDFYKYIDSLINKENSCLLYIYQYIIGKIKRGTNIKEGLKCLEKIPFDMCNFGKHKKSLVCDINYILSISGKYNEAEYRISQFVNTLTDNEKNESYYIKGKIYNSDMLMLRGRFKSAIMQFELLANDVFDKKLSYEIQKAIGHCYRFNFLFDEALKHYKQRGDGQYNKSYYLTVCCETYCYNKPQKVFDLYNEAIDENEKYNNHNNLGKIYYSMAIANIVSHKTDKVRNYIEKAYNEFTCTKYYAGNLFVMIAEIYQEYFETKDVSLQKIEAIKKYVSSIDGIYKYLLLPIYIIKKNYKEIENIKDSYEWLDFNSTISAIKNFLSQA